MLTSANLIIRHPQQLTVEWAQKILTHHLADVKVANVKIKNIDIGTTTRIQVFVEHNGPSEFPRLWFIKLPSLSWRARAITFLPRLLSTEIHFYQHIAQHVPLATAQVLGAASNLFGQSTLVINHVGENGAEPGIAGQALRLEQAQAVIRNLAKLHARFWNKGQDNPDLRRLGGPTRILEDALGSLLAVPLMRLALKKSSHLLSETLSAGAMDYARHRKSIMALLNQAPQTLIHRDCHPGNFFWYKEQPGFLDWQLVRIGDGIADVAYFLATSLESELRQATESDLLELYRKELENSGVFLAAETLRERYRLHLSYPLEAMLLTQAIGGLMDQQGNETMIRRAASAVADNKVFELLREKAGIA